MLESIHVLLFVKLDKLDVQDLLNYLVHLLQNLLWFPKLLKLNLLLIPANILPVLIVMKHVDFAICVVFLDFQVVRNAQVNVLVELKNVPNLAKLDKNNA